jgi:hypothetical protein
MSLGDVCEDLGNVRAKRAKTKRSAKKKSGALAPLKNCVDPYFPRKVGFDLFDEATLLVRVRAPPETWTTKLEPLGQPEAELVDHLFRLVTIFSNDCSKFQHSAK